MPATPATTSKEQMGKGLPGQQQLGQGAVGLGERTVAGGQRSEVGGADGQRDSPSDSSQPGGRPMAQSSVRLHCSCSSAPLH